MPIEGIFDFRLCASSPFGMKSFFTLSGVEGPIGIRQSQSFVILLFSQRFCEKHSSVFCKRVVVFDAKMGKAVKKVKADCQAIDSCPFSCNN
jgi:hypothetical protein